jgi:hypothetical protein
MPLYKPLQQIIDARITEATQLKKTDKHFGSWKSLMFNEAERAMLGTLSGQDANIMAAGKGVTTLFLGLVNDSINLDALASKTDFKGINIAEWVMVGKRSNPQAAAYLNVFGPLGLKENGMLIWLSNEGAIGGYFIINADGSIYTSKIPVGRN